MLGRSLAKRCLGWVPTVLAFSDDYVHNYCRSWLLVLSSLIASVEDVLTRIFEWESRILAVSPCGVYLARESAIVIIGEGDGLGQTIALSFSEHGYTVFVLYPTSTTSGTSGASAQCETDGAKSTDVSSLLYAWHKKKERSTHTSWGLVAPISFDTNSEAQRTHAFETVHTYCAKHSLELAALIVLSPSSPVRRNDSGYRIADTSVNFEHHDSISSTWEREGAHFLMESVFVIDDYSEMIARSSGRVLMLSYGLKGCYFCRPISLLDGVMERIGRNLRQRLETLGVRVTAVSVGPITRANADERDATRCIIKARHSPDGSPTSGSSQRMKRESRDDACSRLHSFVSNLLDSCGVDERVFCDNLHNIVSARYPKYSYSFGLHPILDSISLFTPDVLRQFLTYILR